MGRDDGGKYVEDAALSEARPFPRTVWWLLLLFVALVVTAIFWAIDRFEGELTADATAILQAEGIELSVEFEGRDAVLSGSVTSSVDLDRAVLLIKELTGVREVTSVGVTVVTVSAPSTTTTTLAPEQFPAVVEIAIGESGVTLAGLVPAEARAALVAAAEAVYGPDRVEDNLQVDEAVVMPEWLIELPAAFAEFGVVDQANIIVGDQGLEVAGIVSRADAVELVGIRLAQITNLPVTNQLAFTSLPGPSIVAVASDGVLVLTGELPSQEDVDALVAAATPWFDAIDNRLSLAEVSSADWIARFPGLIDALGHWSNWSVGIGSDGSTMGGFAPSTPDLESLSSGVLQGFDLEWDLGALEVDPDALAAELTLAIAGQINFASGSAVLSAESTAILDGVVEALLENQSAQLVVRGHTDDVGSAASNETLSEKRAQAVVNYLVSGGIDSTRLTAIGVGEAEPIASNATTAGRAQNRRIEFVVRSEGEG
jgi:OOP family OmpA-OmpF porin